MSATGFGRRVSLCALMLLGGMARAEFSEKGVPSLSSPTAVDARPRLAVYGNEGRGVVGREKAVMELVRGAMEEEFSAQPQVKLLSRAQLEAVMSERSLSQRGITEARQWGEVLSADYVLSVAPVLLGKNLSVRVSLLNVLTGEIMLSKERSTPLLGSVPQGSEVKSLLRAWGRELSQYVPRQGQLITGSKERFTLNLGRLQGVRVGDLGRLERRDVVLGQLTVLSVDDLTSQVSVHPSGAVLPQVGDRVRLGLLEAIKPEQRGLWQAGTDASRPELALRVLREGGTELKAGDALAVGEALSLELTAPRAGYPVVISAFPQDEYSYLLYPNASVKSPIRLERGQRWSYPPPTDGVRWVAVEPTGVTLFKVFFLAERPPPLSALEGGRLSPQGVRSLLDLLDATRGNREQAQLNLEIVP